MANTWVADLTLHTVTKNGVAFPVTQFAVSVRNRPTGTMQDGEVIATADQNASLDMLVQASTTAIFGQDGGTGALGNSLSAIGVRIPYVELSAQPGDTITVKIASTTKSYTVPADAATNTTVVADALAQQGTNDNDTSVTKVGSAF